MPNLEQKSNRGRRPKRPNRRRIVQSRGQNNPTRRTSSAVADLRFATPIFPATKRATIRYFENELSYSTATGIPGGYVFSANGCFDPNITGTGHQPIGFDQMMLFFEQYTVVKSKISVDFYNSTGGTLPLRCVLYLSPDTTILSGVSQLMENGEITTGFAQSTNTADRCLRLSIDCDMMAYFGRNRNAKQIVNDVTLSGTSAANPTEQVYFIMSSFDTFTTAASITVYFNVTIEYDVIFWEPRKVTIS
jgi:hypothetical protein